MLEVRPLVVAEGVVVGGNMRLLAMKDLGYREVSVIDVTEWTQEKRDEFMIKDNLSFGDWDYDLLANEWNIDDLTDWGMDLWDTEPEEMQGLTDEDDVPEAPQEPITKLGDVWILGEHRVMCGDSKSKESVEILMDGKKIETLITDPPYGMSFQSNYRKVKHSKIENDQTNTLLISTCGVVCSFASYIFCRWDNLQDVPKPKSLITWVKNNWSMGDLKHEHARQTEVCLFYKGDDHRFPNKRPTDVVTHDRTSNELHPTQKPISLIIEILSWTEGIVLDLFLGSGSTLIAAEKTNRKCYGMELDPKYCDVIIKRWEDFTGKKATKE